MTERSVVVSGGLWVSASKLVTVVSAFVSATLVVRLLSPFDVGIYFSVLAAVGIAALIGSLGVSTPITAFLGESPKTSIAVRRAIVLRGFLITSFGAALVAFLFLLGSSTIIHFISGSNGSVPWWALAGLSSIFVFRGITVETLRALADIRSASVVQALPSSTLATVLLVAWAAGPDLDLASILAFVAVAHLAAIGVGVLILASLLRGPAQTGAPPAIRRYLSIGLPWLGTSALVFTLLQAGVLVVSATSSPSDAAAYGTAFRVATLVSIPASIVVGVLPPFIARYFADGDRSALERLMRAAATISGAAAITATVVTVFAGNWLLSTVFGEFYTAGYTSLVVLSLAFTFDALAGFSGQMLALTGQERIVFKVLLITTPTALILMWMLGNVLGPVGVAIASGLGIVANNIGLAAVAWRTTGTRTWVSTSGSEAVAVATTIVAGIHRKR